MLVQNYRNFLLAMIAINPGLCFAAEAAPAATAIAPAAEAKPAADVKPAAEPKKDQSEEGFITLFDGKTLKGWHRHMDVPKFHVGGKWEVIDGVIVGDQDPPGKGGFLVTDGKYDNFIFRFEVNMDFPSDSGIFLRMGEDGKSHQVTLDNHPTGQFGKIYLPWTQAKVHDSPDGVKSYKQKEWNEGEVRIEGEPARIRFWLNGNLITDFQHTEETTKNVPTIGYVGLQVHPSVPTHVNWKEGNKVRYRNIRVKPLKPGDKQD